MPLIETAFHFWNNLVKMPLINVGNQLTPVRHDRDDFIRVNEENILPKMKNNFVKRPYGDAGFHTAGSVDPEHSPYDLLSVIELSKEEAH